MVIDGDLMCSLTHVDGKQMAKTDGKVRVAGLKLDLPRTASKAHRPGRRFVLSPYLEDSMRRLTPLLILALAACADTATGPTDTPSFARIKEAEDSHGGTPFMAVLVPSTELPVPPGGDPNSAASGVALITLNSGQEEICFKISFSGLSAPVSGAQIQQGLGGSLGVPVVPLAIPAFPATNTGVVAQCVYAPRELIKEIRKNPENYYVNILTRSGIPGDLLERPNGAIGGQITKTQGSTVNHG
jgi:hypothetical protein